MIEANSAAELLDLLTIEELDTDLYRGAAASEGPGRVYGGQVVAQALAAVTRSVGEDRPAHSLHAYFLRGGDPTRPIVYRVLRDFDGGSFANRRVVAMQRGLPILNLAASFHRQEEGPGHAMEAPPAPAPEDCPDFATALGAAGRAMPAAIMERLAAFELRPRPPMPEAEAGVARQFLWFRLRDPLAAEPAMQRVILAYASDFALISTSVLPHRVSIFTPAAQVASLDHTIWFHATPSLDDWLLYAMDSPWSGQARGFARGSIFDRSGRLIASVAQEGLVRIRQGD